MLNFTETEMEEIHKVLDLCFSSCATALSKMLNEKVQTNPCKILNEKTLDWEKIIADLPYSEGWAVYIENKGDIAFGVLLLLSTTDAINLSSLLLGEKVEQGDLKQSAILETGNILSGQFTTSLSQKTGLTMYPSVPYLAIETTRIIMELPIIQATDLSDYNFVVESDFHLLNSDSRINFFLFLDPKQASKIKYMKGDLDEHN